MILTYNARMVDVRISENQLPEDCYHKCDCIIKSFHKDN